MSSLTSLVSNPALYRELCQAMHATHARARSVWNRPLTLAEKILISHASDFDRQAWARGKETLLLRVDHVALQDATAQMVLLQFMQSHRTHIAVPTTIHCDHLIRADVGAKKDLLRAIDDNEEVYTFLSSASRKYGAGFWKPGAGIIHQVVLENHAFPGGLLIGTDSHTPNAGGLGMLSVGVGGADAAEVMSGLRFEVLHPKVIGVRLTGELRGWASPKDVITYLCTLLTTKGGTNSIIEYFGPGTASISATGKATICNMGAELGATGSIFPFDHKMAAYLRATGRSEIAAIAEENSAALIADPEVSENPTAFYDQVVEIDLSTLEPYIVGPHSPDRGRPISKLADEAALNGWPFAITYCLIGSCTNSSYEDMCRAATVVRDAMAKGLKAKVPLLVTPGSDRVFETLKRDGIIALFESIGATVLTNACGPCIGQWHRKDMAPGVPNTIVSSFNRNFPGRNDGSQSTLSFLTSPEIVTAMAFTGRLDLDPTQGLLPPSANELPQRGFERGGEGYLPPSDDGVNVDVIIPAHSERLQLLQAFMAWSGGDFLDLPILAKTKGKTTTDHISPAGRWLQYRGHLEKISDNMLLGAENAFTGEIGKGTNPVTKEAGQSFASLGKDLRAKGISWVIIGDENYGEGSSREHAAMTPRFLGCVAVIARSFARIHETNLKKQGILALTFMDSKDYDRIDASDTLSIVGLAEIKPGEPIKVVIRKHGGFTIEIQANHSLTGEQIRWFKAGSALNVAKNA